MSPDPDAIGGFDGGGEGAAAPPFGASPSSLQAVNEGIEHARARLFPFDINRWILLGFIAFLEQCGRGGGGGNYNIGNPFGGGSGGGGAGDPFQWLRDHVAVVVAVAAVGVALAIGLSALVIFISSRGIFMYIEAVGQGVADLEGGWRRHAHLAQSLFVWRLGIAVGSILLIVAVIGAGAAVVVGSTGGSPNPTGIVGGVVGLFLGIMAITFASAIVNMVLRDFVAPIQLAGQLPCGAAVREAMRLFGAYPLAFLGYVLLKIPYAFLLVAATLLAGCTTCCLGFLPVISQAILQPFHAFERAWSLCLLRQMGIDVTRDASDTAEAAVPPL